jgi:hypothetical protein
MSAHKREVPAKADLQELPEFEIDCIFDDTETPTEVTLILPETERTLTEWMTADTSDAMDLSEIR